MPHFPLPSNPSLALAAIARYLRAGADAAQQQELALECERVVALQPHLERRREILTQGELSDEDRRELKALDAKIAELAKPTRVAIEDMSIEELRSVLDETRILLDSQPKRRNL